MEDNNSNNSINNDNQLEEIENQDEQINNNESNNNQEEQEEPENGDDQLKNSEEEMDEDEYLQALQLRLRGMKQERKEAEQNAKLLDSIQIVIANKLKLIK